MVRYNGRVIQLASLTHVVCRECPLIVAFDPRAIYAEVAAFRNMMKTASSDTFSVSQNDMDKYG